MDGSGWGWVWVGGKGGGDPGGSVNREGADAESVGGPTKKKSNKHIPSPSAPVSRLLVGAGALPSRPASYVPRHRGG